MNKKDNRRYLDIQYTSKDDVIDELPEKYFQSYLAFRYCCIMQFLNNGSHDCDFYRDVAIMYSHKVISEIEKRALPKYLTALLAEEIKKEDEEKLLKGILLKMDELVALYLEAGKQGFLFSQYVYESDIPKDFEGRVPFLVDMTNDSVNTVGHTELSEAALKTYVKQTNRCFMQILKKGSRWIAFYRTKRGVAGEEPGKIGKLPHFHYISSAYGIPLEKVISDFKQGHEQSCGFHVLLDESQYDTCV